MKLANLKPQEFKRLNHLVQDCIWNQDYREGKIVDGFTLCLYPNPEVLCPYKKYSESYGYRCELGARFPLDRKMKE